MVHNIRHKIKIYRNFNPLGIVFVFSLLFILLGLAIPEIGHLLIKAGSLIMMVYAICFFVWIKSMF